MVAALLFGAFPLAPAIAVTPEAVSFPGGAGVTLKAQLYLPEAGGKHPAVVGLHGCGGLFTRTGKVGASPDDWGRRLANAGFIVVFPDSFGSRGLGPQCREPERTVRPWRERVDDTRATLAWLVQRPDVKPDAISLIGWSNGGSTALYAVRPANAPSAGPDFAKAVAFYPGCLAPAARPGTATRLPLMILIGEADDWTPAQPCRDLSARAGARGEPVSIVTYPGAWHAFDNPALPVLTLKGLAFTAGGDGVAHMGTDAAGRADALQRVPAFLAR